MCQFFSAIVFRTGQIRWCESDSHERIIARLRLDDAAPLETRSWVRVECVPPHESVRVDETSTPGWYDEDRPAIDGRVMDLALRVATARKAHNEAEAAGWKAYNEAVAPSLKAYNEAESLPRNAYDEAVASAWNTDNGAEYSAQKAYDEAVAPPWKAYSKARSAARKAYDEAVAPSLKAYIGIEGYTPETA